MHTAAYDPRSYAEDHVFDAPGLLGWLTRRRKALVMSFLNGAISTPARARILDVGCGYGDMLVESTARTRVGVDVNLDALRHAAGRARAVHFALGAVEQLPFKSGSFDGVICSEVLEHLDEPQRLAREIERITRPGGSICITVPNEMITTVGRFVLGKRPAKSPAHKQDFTPRTVAALFSQPPVRQQLTPFSALPFSLATNVVMLFTKA
jgi:ubiquinone/menaquinone biosynthesis C-methylase UbiE